MIKNNKFINLHEDGISNYLRDVRKSSVLTADEEIELAKKIQMGDMNALHELVKRNLRFVITIAKEYQGQGIPLSDLINEGNYGLVIAAKRFDHTKGFKFISYAVWWIRQSILQSLNDHSRTIRLPTNVINKLSKIKKQIEKLESNSDYTHDEYTDEDIEKIFHPTVSSLNTQINEDGDELLDIIEDQSIKQPDDEKFTSIELKNELEKIMSKVLTPREIHILKCYYGVGGVNMTLEDIGEELELTKERVRQIKMKAIRKLRYESDALQDYLGE